MSYRTEHPVHCARQGDLGCKAEHPGSRWDAMKADREGWFHSKTEGAFCPAHVPDWVPAWRERQAAKLHKVKKSFTKLPAVVKCAGCVLHRTEQGEDPEVLTELRDLAWQHARETGHSVTVTTTQELTVEPVDS
jgi:hypothetical protein